MIMIHDDHQLFSVVIVWSGVCVCLCGVVDDDIAFRTSSSIVLSDPPLMNKISLAFLLLSFGVENTKNGEQLDWERGANGLVFGKYP